MRINTSSGMGQLLPETDSVCRKKLKVMVILFSVPSLVTGPRAWIKGDLKSASRALGMTLGQALFLVTMSGQHVSDLSEDPEHRRRRDDQRREVGHRPDHEGRGEAALVSGRIEGLQGPPGLPHPQPPPGAGRHGAQPGPHPPTPASPPPTLSGGRTGHR